MSEGLAQGPYVADRVRFEPATFRIMQGTEPTTEPQLQRRLHEAHTCISVMLLHVRAIGLSLTQHSRSYRRLLLLKATTTSSCNTSLSGGRRGPQGGSRSRGPTPS